MILRILFRLVIVVLFYGVPWLIAAMLAGGSRDAQLGSALGIALFAVGAMLLSVRSRRAGGWTQHRRPGRHEER